MLRRIGLLCLLVALVAIPATAQNDWFVMLFNSLTREFVRVNADGTQETYALDLPENLYVGARDTAFSSDGSRVAFCVVEYRENNQNVTTLYVRELASGTSIVAQDLGSSIACRVTGNDDFSQLAVALVRHFSGDPQADTSLPGWELLIVDSTTGQTQYTVNPESPLAASITYTYGETFLPYVLRFDESEVIFGEVPYGTEFPPDFPVYAWQLDADTLEQTEGWGYPFPDFLESTGEFASLEQDPTLPAGEPMGPVPISNIVTVTDASGATQVVYHSPDRVLVGVEFIEGGERLMLLLTESFDPNNPNDIPDTYWIALDRQGNVAELFSSDGFATLTAAPDGFLVFSTESDTLPATYTLVYHGEGGVSTLLTLESDQYGAWEIAYVSPSTPTDGLPPFTPIIP
jgi:hypothetical protein